MIKISDIEKFPSDKLVKFYRENNNFNTNVIVLLGEKIIQKLSILNSKVISINNQDDMKEEILGCVISIPITYDLDKEIIHHVSDSENKGDDINFQNLYDEKTVSDPKNSLLESFSNIGVLTTFLCLKKDKRGMNYARSLIQGIIKFAKDHGIKTSFQITTKKVANFSILINTWYIPLNRNKLISEGWENVITFEKNDLPNSINDIFVCKVERETIYENLSREYYIENTKNFKIKFFPTEELWKRWIQVFDTFVILNEKTNNVLGLFSYMICDICINDQKNLSIPYFLIATGNPEIFILETIKYLSKKDYSILCIYETQNIDENILKLYNGVKIDTETWFSIYDHGCKNIISSKDISFPLF